MALTEHTRNAAVLVCGSRTWDDADAIVDRIGKLPRGTTVIQGGAEGADLIAGRAAFVRGLRTKTYRADWARLGRRAGIVRNLEMLDTGPALVIAFWDGESRGTAHTIREAQRRGIPVEVIT